MGRAKRAQDLLWSLLVKVAEELPIKGLNDHFIDERLVRQHLDASSRIARLALDQRHAACLNGIEGFLQGRNSRAAIFRIEPGSRVKALDFGGGFTAYLDVGFGPMIG